MFITIEGPLSVVRQIHEQSADDLLDLAHTENFLDVRDRGEDVMSAGVSYDRMSGKNVFRFNATAVTGSGSYEVVLRLETLKNLIDAFESRPGKVDLSTVKEMLKRGFHDGEVDVSCECPAFKWWGFKYFNSQRDTVFGRGNDFYPDIRSPEAQANSGLCKHLYATLKLIDQGDFLDSMAEDLIERIDVNESVRYIIDSVREGKQRDRRSTEHLGSIISTIR